MTTFSFYSFRIFRISHYINFKKFLGRILAPPSGRHPGADAPPAPPLATPLDPQHTAKGWYMYDLGCSNDFTVDIHVITMVRIRLWLFGIISAMLGLRMLQLLCRLPINLHSYYIRINVRFEHLAIAFEHILIRHNIQQW